MKISLILMSICALLITGCSNPLGDTKSYVDSNYGPATSPAVPVPVGLEIIAGSKAAAQTQTARHQVDVTVGAATSEIRLRTAKNKLIYLSVQGQMISSQ